MRPVTDESGLAPAAHPSPSEASPLTVTSATAADRGAWDAFVDATPGGSFYHLFDWKGLIERELGHRSEYLVARRADATHRRSPAAGVRRKPAVRPHPLLDALHELRRAGRGHPRRGALLVARGNELAREFGADYLELRCAAPLETSMPVSLRKISMTVPLMSDPGETVRLVHEQTPQEHPARAEERAQRRRWRSRTPADVSIRCSSSPGSSLGTPLYSRRYFEAIVDTFGDRVRIFVCRQKETPIAVAFNGHGNGAVEGMWAGADPAFRNLQPNYVLYWEMLRDACTRGLTRFHLGRSTADSGAEEFKSKWNAEVQQLYWYFQRPDGGPMPALNVDNPKYRWRSRPGAACRCGPRVSRAAARAPDSVRRTVRA